MTHNQTKSSHNVESSIGGKVMLKFSQKVGRHVPLSTLRSTPMAGRTQLKAATH